MKSYKINELYLVKVVVVEDIDIVNKHINSSGDYRGYIVRESIDTYGVKKYELLTKAGLVLRKFDAYGLTKSGDVLLRGRDNIYLRVGDYIVREVKPLALALDIDPMLRKLTLKEIIEKENEFNSKLGLSNAPFPSVSAKKPKKNSTTSDEKLVDIEDEYFNE